MSAGGYTLPTNKAGYEKARRSSPDIADSDVAHILTGDPLGEAMTNDLEDLAPEEPTRLIEAQESAKW